MFQANQRTPVRTPGFADSDAVWLRSTCDFVWRLPMITSPTTQGHCKPCSSVTHAHAHARTRLAHARTSSFYVQTHSLKPLPFSRAGTKLEDRVGIAVAHARFVECSVSAVDIRGQCRLGSTVRMVQPTTHSGAQKQYLWHCMHSDPDPSDIFVDYKFDLILSEVKSPETASSWHGGRRKSLEGNRPPADHASLRGDHLTGDQSMSDSIRDKGAQSK